MHGGINEGTLFGTKWKCGTNQTNARERFQRKPNKITKTKTKTKWKREKHCQQIQADITIVVIALHISILKFSKSVWFTVRRLCCAAAAAAAVFYVSLFLLLLCKMLYLWVSVAVARVSAKPEGCFWLLSVFLLFFFSFSLPELEQCWITIH